MTEKSPAIGIDLGTTYSCVAVYEYGTVEIIANDQGSRITPSYVAFTERERLIGEAAKNQVTLNPENTVFDTKRLIGRRFDEESVQADIKHFPFAVVNDKDRPNIEVEYKDQKMKLTPEEISSMILVRMKETAEAHLGKKVTDAVITVPAYFNNAQREATKNAGEIAGLNVLRIINEPTAAAIAYGLDKKAKGEKNILIFDLGGGTFDVSILSIDDGVFEVKSTCGDTHLGGEDFDNRLVDYFVQEFSRKSGKDISNDKKALRRLRSACEMAKRTLSSASQTTIEIPALADGIDFSSNITRAKFDDLCLDLFQATLNSVQKAIVDAELEKADIDEIVLVGGSTRIPRVQRLLRDYFEGKELNTAINPDEAVAYGAAVQAAIITGIEPEVLQDLLLLDILPISLGIETVGGVMTTLIPRNSTIPTKQQHPATPDSIHQTNVYVTVYEGERQLTKDNNLLGEFILEGIKRATEDYFPIIDVTFEVDVNGILKVSAMDTDTKVQNEIIITKEAGRLTQEQIAEMQKQAELFQQDDQNERNRIEALNELKRYVEHIRATLEQTISRANIAPNEQKQIDNKVGEITNWLSDTPLAGRNETEAKRNELKNIWDPIARKIHN